MDSREKPPATVERFPPLPRLPEPPVFPADPRQRLTAGVIGALVEALASGTADAGPNFRTGFQASSVDLGRLQSVLAAVVERFDESALEERWSEVFDWTWRVIRSWVQRCKAAKIERCGRAIHVELETQDDHGVYKYAFDVFPRREP